METCFQTYLIFINRLFIGCFERKTGCFNGKKYTPKEKKFNQIYFQTDFKYCFRGIFKKLIPAVTDLTSKQNAIDR